MSAGSDDPATVVHAFNAAINARDLDALSALMTDGHRFVDAAGGAVTGKAACRDAWRGFFETFPDYRNTFTTVGHAGDGVVVVAGRSECSDPRLEGPAEWRAVVHDGLVAEWQVIDPDQ